MKDEDLDKITTFFHKDDIDTDIFYFIKRVDSDNFVVSWDFVRNNQVRQGSTEYAKSTVIHYLTSGDWVPRITYFEIW